MGSACAKPPTDEQMQHWDSIEAKMTNDKVSADGIAAFKNSYSVLVSGASTMVEDVNISPVDSLPDLETLDIELKPEYLAKTVILKLNGGLGTGMGLDKAKSLLEVVNGDSFLDLIAKQIDATKKNPEFGESGKALKFILMNSFSTSEDTKNALAKYPDLGTGDDLEFLQNKAPKIVKSDFTAATYAPNPENEWCPPGHGDIYPAIKGSGTLKKLIDSGKKYMFVSNSDNLGATLDLKILTHFANSGSPFMMEVATRTDADKKGGHLAKTNEDKPRLLLRESAQCTAADEESFQNVGKWKYFNTNNLWIDLEALQAAMSENPLPLPIITNDKTVNPTDKASTPVVQLETAMGAAISCFEGASALLIPRSRFAPVKTTNDLLALRSDAYEVTADSRIVLHKDRNGTPPNIKLDGCCKFVGDYNKYFPEGSPSLIGCAKLEVKGKVIFSKGVVIKGNCKIIGGDEEKTLPAGTYENEVTL